jgi:flagellar basal-body rod modification protein FlgD
MSTTIASVAYQQTQAAVAAANALASGTSNSSPAATGSASAGATGASDANSAFSQLSSNFNDFLNLLMTQLQNQDPTDPLDANQFTSELVQFTQVQQQINTNSSLTQLIQLTQAGDLTQATAMLGSEVTATASQIPLQNGTGSLSFTAAAAEPVAIAVYDQNGDQILDTAVNATTGSNTWTWNGTDAMGNTVPDGAYNVAVVGQNADGTTTTLPFSITGVATGVTSGANSSLDLQLGPLSIPFSAVTSVANNGSSPNS